MRFNWYVHMQKKKFFPLPKAVTSQIRILGEPDGKKMVVAYMWLWFVLERKEK